MKIKSIIKVLLSIWFFSFTAHAEDGYKLWLNYKKVDNANLLKQYRTTFKGCYAPGNSPTIKVATDEIIAGTSILLGTSFQLQSDIQSGTVVIATSNSLPDLKSLGIGEKLEKLGTDGFLIKRTNFRNKKCTIITANTDVGLLYGVFHFLKTLQTHRSINSFDIESAPKLQVRALNHWDNLDGSVERGYAGTSIWKWDELPSKVDPRYKDYARANASIGINATVLNNVNANPRIMTAEYLPKVKALADIMRPYGIKVYLSISFNAPSRIGGLKTSDPLDPQVIAWWQEKTKEIYRYIPDFGGFLVKANSEGQPGPQDFGRTHADGANMLAQAVKPYNGIVMWRAFVYNANPAEDRTLQAYNSFKPFDGLFDDNVLVQIKNGPIDFQPREPFSPLFGAMPKTSLMIEFQVTQEYLGFSKHLVFLAPLYSEVLGSDTYAKGKGTTVAKIIEGQFSKKRLTGMAGVSNIGNAQNWCGHPFAQANWYALGRLAWNPETSSDAIADDWIRMTFSNTNDFVDVTKDIMLTSREAAVNYMTPLGLHHIMAYDTHNGPGPWVDTAAQPNWKSTYYHNASTTGLGYNRTSTGSNAVAQYFPEVRDEFNSLNTCPENLLLWFHLVSWDYKMKSGKTLWDELCLHYYAGVDSVRAMQTKWNSLSGIIDGERFKQIDSLLKKQEEEAVIWRNSCVLYFQQYSKKPIPAGFEIPKESLDYYRALKLD